MKQHETNNDELSDTQIIKTLQDAADSGDVFASTREWSLEKMRESINSRGDYFDRNGAVVFELEGREVFRISVNSLPVTIGSGEYADFRLDYAGISRVHCRLVAVGNLVRISDDHSKNGVRLNGKSIEAEDLCDGDVLQLGTVQLRVGRV
ncbi:FHA domain-containing protein FhaA [Pontiella desulfatans]|uniref:FHA domain-containing protein FhaA n=1 Tax=Pontiella desulfatans TaxID=2750659 RepID=A0A6C2TXL8_PONDE|nr:FHA domain-containing protein [Pontiella desulfatans]VGO12081.1 FHA domain-containing protein FhaA [Pontiella desulfatans]